jgi:N-acetylglucosamine-6-phosphate deacetylase
MFATFLNMKCAYSIATSDIAVEAVKNGARLITHLFNAMPQLHHRDPSIIGLLGASPHLHLGAKDPVIESAVTAHAIQAKKLKAEVIEAARSEAFDDIQTPPQSPVLAAQHRNISLISPLPSGIASPRARKGTLSGRSFERPFYEMIVDGIHSHPHSVRVNPIPSVYVSTLYTNAWC